MSYISRESGEPKTSFSDADALVKILSKVANFNYVIEESSSDFPPPSANAKWYLLVNDAIEKIGHFRLIWVDGDGNIRTESMDLGSTDEWIEQDYGDEKAAASTELEYSDLQSTLNILAEKFPRSGERLRAYQQILAEVSAKYGANLELIQRGGKVIAMFSVGTTIIINGLTEDQKVERIKFNLKALKEAWDRIGGYEEAMWERRLGNEGKGNELDNRS